ncbi:hypothetical protein PBI_WAITS_94 [Gordonia phage Waits]|uniref:Uncharacterized protein n=1 Tax=Gordonia phage Waits TaxID=2108120 RepID=A0A2P1JSM2_9CAUD|nr:hypothetical protein FDJ48_gp016 [Gordonia phage Waits]AVO22121.1 hypothetical protein PBI_WAITS_94 [Gordonia phage Waits]
MTRPTARYIVRETSVDCYVVDTETDKVVKTYKRLGNAIRKARELNKLEIVPVETHTPEARPLHVIADEIRKTWKNPYFGAVPYIEAMARLLDVGSNYGWDSGDSIVRYFLANAGTWRGEDAKRIKAELKAMVK